MIVDATKRIRRWLILKWKTKIRRTATTTSAILLAIMLTACSDNNGNNTTPTATPDNGQTQGSVPNESLPEDTGVLDPGTLTPDDNNESTDNEGADNEGTDNETTNNETVSDVISAQGTYIGAADGHSVEIQVNNETIVFQIDDSLVHIIDEYESNLAVNIEYVEKTIEGLDVKQPWLTKIDKQ